jgi:hypothetical protein
MNEILLDAVALLKVEVATNVFDVHTWEGIVMVAVKLYD